MSAGIGNLVADLSVRNFESAGVVRYGGNHKVHIIFSESRLACGPWTNRKAANITRERVQLTEDERWCYSCIGNAAEALDR
jgi:hypothetical protein